MIFFNTKTYFLLFSISFLLTSCATTAIQMSELRPQGVVYPKLPSLEPHVNIGSLENAYSLGTTISSGSAYSDKTIFGGIVTIGTVASTNYKDKRVNDALILFEREVKDNITDYIGESKGKIIFKITNSQRKTKPKVGNIVVSFIPFAGFPVIAGIKVVEVYQSVEVEIEIRDRRDNPVGRFSVYGESTEEGNIYNINTTAARRANIDALKQAMRSFKSKLGTGTDLIKKLN